MIFLYVQFLLCILTVPPKPKYTDKGKSFQTKTLNWFIYLFVDWLIYKHKKQAMFI